MMDPFYLVCNAQVSSMPASAQQYNLVYANPPCRIVNGAPNDDLYRYRQEGAAYQFPLHTTLPPYTTTSTEQSDAYIPLRDSGRKSKSKRSKEIPLAVLARRRAQNRESQRAYRNRKDSYIRGLENRLSEVNEKYEKLLAEHEKCSVDYMKVQERVRGEVCENQRMKGDWKGGYSGYMSPADGFQEQLMCSPDEHESLVKSPWDLTNSFRD